MTAKFERPPLSPQFCFSTRELKDFLRLSRATIDDTISQNLNALSTPSRDGFDPNSTFQRTIPTFRFLPADKCRQFTDNVLMASWQSRSDVLNYCASVATSEDPEDPDSLARLGETAAERERTVDERLDPYSGRFFPKETRTQILATVVRNERMVEEIVRERSWKIVKERCGEFGVPGDNWKTAMDEWRQRMAPIIGKDV
ncbi:hypothetical protein RUND412_005026 [Rhizina undulata]